MSKVSFDSIPWESTLPHARSKAVARDGRQLRILEIDREFVEPGWCTKGHVGYVLTGELQLEFADRTERFLAGDGFFIAPGEAEKHRPVALTDSVRMLLVEAV